MRFKGVYSSVVEQEAVNLCVAGSNPARPVILGPLAQLVRAPGSYPDCPRFKPERAHHLTGILSLDISLTK